MRINLYFKVHNLQLQECSVQYAIKNNAALWLIYVMTLILKVHYYYVVNYIKIKWTTFLLYKKYPCLGSLNNLEKKRNPTFSACSQVASSVVPLKNGQPMLIINDYT